MPSHNLHQMSQCSVFKVHLELSLIEALNYLKASINAISGGFSPRCPNRSPAQRVRFGRGRRSQRNVVFAHFSQRENGMQLASSDVLVGQSGLEPPTSRLSVVCSSQLSYWPISSGVPGLSLPPTLHLVEISGFEPLTSCLQGRRSPS